MLRHPKIIPSTSGVYFFKDRRGKNLYIGKAANLKSRLSSYFRNTPRDPRLTKMLEVAIRVDWQETPSEIESLILESQLIKRNRPSFNILLRDDKQYFFVTFTHETFPRLIITHQPNLKFRHFNISSPMGPFTEGTALRATLKLLRRIFPYCTCKQTHHRRCLNAHLEKCPGYCCLKLKSQNAKVKITSQNLKIYEKEYGKNIIAIKEILSGKSAALVKDLEQEMKEVAAQENFSQAIELRDKIAQLNQVFANAKVIKEISARDDLLALMQKTFGLPTLPQRIEGYDIANIHGQFATGSMVVFTNGQTDKNEYRKFKIRLDGSPDDTGMLKEMLQRRFNHPEWPSPDLILIDGGKGQLNAAQATLSESGIMNHESRIRIMALTKNEKHRGDHVFLSNKKELYPPKFGKAKIGRAMALQKLPPSVSNLILQIDSEAHRFAIGYYRRLHRQALSPCVDAG